MHKIKYQYHNPKVVSYEEEETIKNLLLYHKVHCQHNLRGCGKAGAA